MPYLAAAVVLACALGLLNLILTFGVIRRLREHTELLSTRHEPAPRPIAEPGTRIDEFAATTVGGRPFTSDTLVGPTLVGFFSSRCPACDERMPDFLAYAERVPGGRDRIFAVVLDTGDDNAALVQTLEAVAHVIVEPKRNGPLSTVFQVQGTPALCLVDPDLRVIASGFDATTLPVPQAA